MTRSSERITRKWDADLRELERAHSRHGMVATLCVAAGAILGAGLVLAMAWLIR